MNCPICESGYQFTIKTVNGYAIDKCPDCGVEFCREMPSEETLAKFYGHYSDHLSSEPVARLNAKRNIEDLCLMCADHILDFGCGAGHFVSVAHEMGLSFTRGLDRYRGQIALPAIGPWEWITLWGVLEHMTDPFDELCGLYQRLAPKGRIVLTTVSIETPIPYRHKPPEHTLYFTRAAIAALADRCGFRIIEYRPYRMVQDSDVYLDTLLRTMPDEYQSLVTHSMPKYVEIPTNEVFVVMEKV